MCLRKLYLLLKMGDKKVPSMEEEKTIENPEGRIENIGVEYSDTEILSDPISGSLHEDEVIDPEKKEESSYKTNLPKPVVDVRMPNQMCEMPCLFKVNETTNGDQVCFLSSSDDEGDFSFDEETQSITGVPHRSREYWMKLEGKDAIYCFSCFVNNNPRLMWKEIPSDQLVKTDKDYKAYLSPNVDLVAVSHRGRTHAQEGNYRDDDFFISMVDNCALTIVADGAGSAARSSTGSKVYCKEAGRRFCELFESKKDVLLPLLEEVKQREESPLKNQEVVKHLYELFPASALYGRQVLSQMATDNQVPLKQYHTTALFSITIPISSGECFCAAFQIGDGITAVLTDGKLELLGEADSGNFPGETVFVTSNGVFDDASALVNRIKACFCDAPFVLISMTDGITDSYFKEGLGVGEKELWDKLMSEIQNDKGALKPANEICDWLNYYIPQEHDDRTMAIVKMKK